MYDKFKENVTLAEYTSIGLGGAARFFYSCDSLHDVVDAVSFARRESLDWTVLGGGSNIIYQDRGFNGLVVHIAIPGVHIEDSEPGVLCQAGAGVVWDDFVKNTVEKGLTGLECLSGIPGYVGGVPIQNVGAYGQEVRERIVVVSAVDTETLQLVQFSNSECEFDYRRSRFKFRDKGRYIITGVTFRLTQDARPEPHYPELRRRLEADSVFASLKPGAQMLGRMREIVLDLRRSKSMVLDDQDPDSRSCGSFFMNPIMERSRYEEISNRFQSRGGQGRVPCFETEQGLKVPAAWLVEQSGFPKGFQKGGVGISRKHSLALINRGGSTDELLALAAEIQSGVKSAFGVELEREPVVV